MVATDHRDGRRHVDGWGERLVPWFKVDDGFWSHPKVIELSAEAGWLWARAGSYSAHHLTDGVVTGGTLRMLGATRDAAVELVMAGLWDHDEVAKTWQFHDWDEYQPSREQVEADRRKAAERMREVRANRRRTFEGGSPSPTRPDPTPSPKGEGAPSAFCSNHPNGTEGACRACGNARRRLDAHNAAEKTKPTLTPTRAAECATHPGYPLPCHRCEEEDHG